MYFVVTYQVVDDYVERRAAYRQEHLTLARSFAERGDMVLGGAFEDASQGAMIIFRGDDISVAEAFVNNDPYVQNGLVTSWSIRTWNVVSGSAYDGPSPV